MAKKLVKKLVSIIIVTRNRKELILKCLDSVFKMNYPKFEVIVVDNGSTDGTIDAVKAKYKKIKLIAAKKNFGLNGGKNLGQRKAKGDFIFFLDSDTVVAKNLLTELVALAESDEKIGLVCPKMYYSDQKKILWYAGVKVNLFTSQTKNIGCNEKDLGQYDAVKETLFAPTAYLATRELVEKLVGHEEVFFMTYGDTDYGFRAKESGFKVMFCPQARLWHHLNKEDNTKTIRALGYNLPLRAYYFARNRVIFMKRHAPKFNFYIFLFFFFPLATFYITYKILVFKGGWQFLRPHLEGSFDGLRFALGGKINNAWK